MRSIKMVGLAIVAMFAFSAVAASAASAHSFMSTGEGGTLTGEGGVQVFQAGGNFVECKKETTTGLEEIEAGEDVLYSSITVLVHYAECTATAFGIKLEANVTSATFLFDAGNTVAVKSPAVTISVPAAGCSITVGETNNQELGGITYENNENGTITVNAKVEKEITWTGTGGACGTGGSEGTYEGSAGAELPGSTISWE